MASLFSGIKIAPKEAGLIDGLVVVCGLGQYGLMRIRKPRVTVPVATLEKANRVKPGMTPQEVVSIFGSPGWSPTAAPGSISTITQMSWTNRNYSGVGVLFENGRVINVVRTGDLPQEESTE